MKTTSTKLIALVDEYYDLKAELKTMTERADLIRTQLKNLMGDEMVLEAGDYVVVREKRSRKDLNRDAVEHDFGHGFFEEYFVKSEYEVLKAIKTVVEDESKQA